MLEHLKQGCMNVLTIIPNFLWSSAEPLLKKKWSQEYLEQLQLERFARYLVKHFDEAWERAAQNRKCMVIKKGQWLSTYLNVAVINNIISLSIYALFKGYVPVIRINEDEPSRFNWDWYFRQPYDVMQTDISGFEETTCDIVHSQLRADMQIVYDPKGWRYQLFKMLFQRLIQLNEKT